MSPADLRPVADHLWQSSLFCGSGRPAGTGPAQESRTIAPLAVAHRLGQISNPPLGSLRLGRSACVAHSSAESAARLLRCDPAGQPAIRESSRHGASPAAGRTFSKPASGSFVGHLGMRFRCDRLLVVGSVAAHPCDGPQCFALAVGNTDPGEILACPSRARCFRDLPACSVVAARHLRAIDAHAIAGRHHTRALPRPLSG